MRKERREKKQTNICLDFCDRFVLAHKSHIFPISVVEKAGVFGYVIAPCGQAKQQHKAPGGGFFFFFSSLTDQTRQYLNNIFTLKGLLTLQHEQRCTSLETKKKKDIFVAAGLSLCLALSNSLRS